MKKRAEEKIIINYDCLFEQSIGRNGEKKNPVFRKLIKLNFSQLLLSMFVLVLQFSPVWVVPICTANIIDLATQAVVAGSASAEVWRKIIINAAVMGVLILQNVPTTVWRWEICSKMLRRTSSGIKSSVVRKLQSLSTTYQKDMQTGKIQSKFLKDTDTVDGLFHALLFSLLPNALSALVAVGISFYRNGWVSLFFLLIIPCNVGLTYFFRKTIRHRHRDYRIKTEKMSAKLTTMLEMLPVTKAHGLEGQETEKIEQSIYELESSGRKMDTTFGRFGSWSWVINALLSAVCLVFCAVLAVNKVITVGEIALYQAMFTTISSGISALINILPNLSGGFEALASITELMETQEIERTEGKSFLSSVEGKVQLQGVYYQYPNTPDFVLRNLNLDVKAGECIAVVGSSGSGKSTLMNMIIGLLPPTKGRILVDGEDISELNLREYRKSISVVLQNSILFSGSIRENIVYGLDEYTEEQLQSAVEMANLKEFIEELPSGLDTQVGEHGDKLSGGQKQRVTIARALIRNPKIIILDEATSSLDSISEYHVQQAIAKSIRGRTTFIVAHRLSTIRDADRIVVLENGEAVEIGTYDELMQKQGRFYELKRLNDLKMKTADSALL